MSAPSVPPRLAGALTLYALARVGLVAVVAGLLVLAGVPLVIAVLVALIVALPLSMLLLRGLRARLDAGLATRAEQRAQLRARLRGEPPPDPERVVQPSSDAGESEPDPGRG